MDIIIGMTVQGISDRLSHEHIVKSETSVKANSIYKGALFQPVVSTNSWLFLILFTVRHLIEPYLVRY